MQGVPHTNGVLFLQNLQGLVLHVLIERISQECPGRRRMCAQPVPPRSDATSRGLILTLLLDVLYLVERNADADSQPIPSRNITEDLTHGILCQLWVYMQHQGKSGVCSM